MNDQFRKPQLGDPDYSPRDFFRELTGGRMRWIATAFALLSVLATLCFCFSILPAEIHWPVHMQGRIVTVLTALVAAVWTLIACTAWRTWARHRHTS
jgi:hypothetical protein